MALKRQRDGASDLHLLAGDAGSFIDPLSSAGVKKALASAWLAAVAVSTGDPTYANENAYGSTLRIGAASYVDVPLR